MDISKPVVLVGVALAISVTVTGLLTVGVPFLDGEPEPVEVEQDLDRTPSPASTMSFDPGTPPAPSNSFAEFVDVAGDVGFDYGSNFQGTGTITRSGVYVADVDNDGYEDILAIGGNYPVLYENTGGAYERSQEFDLSDARTAHFFDANNNGYRDLVFAEYGGNIVFYENDNGTFNKRSVGLDTRTESPVSITSADFTGNGCLDLFVSQNGLWQAGHPMEATHARDVADEHPDIRPETTPGGENYLFYGHQNCTEFSDATGQAGIRGENWTLAVSAVDFTGNGYPDIHVGNDFSADFLYENTGNGTFERHDLGPDTDRNAMASIPVDVTGNHHLDLFVTNIYFEDHVESTARDRDMLAAVPEGNNLLINQNGSGTFVDRAPEHGLEAGGWGWATAVEDFTNDGHLDIIHGTSKEVPVEPYDEYRGKQVWKGTADSWERADGDDLGFGRHESRGLAALDYNNDGVLDVLVGTSSGHQRGGGGTSEFALYENQHANDDSLQLFVRNPDGIERNAAVFVETNQRTIYRPVRGGADFLSQDSRLLHFGLGNEALESVTVVWPDRTEIVYEDLDVGNRYILTPEETRLVE